MPQIFQVLKCYKCFVFQIHLSKKSNKFECKVCGEKQSIKRHYGIGTGKDCRLHVQRLNGIRGEIEEMTSTRSGSDEFEEISDSINNSSTIPNLTKTFDSIKNFSTNPTKRSRWSEFVDEEEKTIEELSNEPIFFEGKEVVLETPQKRKTRKFKVKFNPTNNIEHDLNYTSGVKSRSDVKENNIDNFKSEKVLKSIQGSSENNDKNVAPTEQANDKQFINTPVSVNKISLQELQTKSAYSKWAEFVDSDEENQYKQEDSLCSNEHNEILVKSDNLFSLCDDSDLDHVLDI